jgi:hypothetical protein
VAGRLAPAEVSGSSSGSTAGGGLRALINLEAGGGRPSSLPGDNNLSASLGPSASPPETRLKPGKAAPADRQGTNSTGKITTTTSSSSTNTNTNTTNTTTTSSSSSLSSRAAASVLTRVPLDLLHQSPPKLLEALADEASRDLTEAPRSVAVHLANALSQLG